jgi:hypothetical protein
MLHSRSNARRYMTYEEYLLHAGERLAATATLRLRFARLHYDIHQPGGNSASQEGNGRLENS